MNAAPVASPPAPAVPGAAAREHFYWIDWLRFLAAAVVVAVHTREFNWSAWSAAKGSVHTGAPGAGEGLFLFLTGLGYEAIVLFFVLSGWLVGGKALERVRRGTFDASDYAADRLARLYVPLVPALLLTAAVVRGYDLPLAPAQYLACLVGLQSAYVTTPYMNVPLWTLGYETWFYALAGCVGAACARRLPPGARFAAGAGAALSLALLLHRREGAYLGCWLLGAAGYVWRDRLPRGRAVFLLAMAATVAADTLMRRTDAGGVLWPGAWTPTPGAAHLLLAAGAVGVVANLARARPASRLGQGVERLGTRLAAFSYTLYLVHCPVLWSLALPTAQMPPVLDGRSLGRAASWMAVCAAVALAMYALFEARTPAVRRWLRAKFARTRPGRPAVSDRPVFGPPSLAAR